LKNTEKTEGGAAPTVLPKRKWAHVGIGDTVEPATPSQGRGGEIRIKYKIPEGHSRGPILDLPAPPPLIIPDIALLLSLYYRKHFLL
jgi:hypothetical protein